MSSRSVFPNHFAMAHYKVCNERSADVLRKNVQFYPAGKQCVYARLSVGEANSDGQNN